MTTITPASRHASDAYDLLARDYDDYTAGYVHDKWFAELETRALRIGLRGRRALDLACGTGKSTAPLLARGYTVQARDISTAMVAEARRKFPLYAGCFEVADMRQLPALGTFDLVVCLDDALNYLLSQDELEAAFAGAARVMAREGVLVFDLNTLATYRTAFARTSVRESAGRFFAWRGETEPDLLPGGHAAATIEVFTIGSDGAWRRRTSRHRQRHHPRGAVVEALARAGLRCCAVYGQHPGAVLRAEVDELRAAKLVYFAKRVGDAWAPHCHAPVPRPGP
jgi:SAM-dependent methyltransferase